MEFVYLNTSYSEPINFNEEPRRSLSKDYGIPVYAGDKLPNGAIILKEEVIRTFDHRRDSIVLCVAGGYQPFVTWIRVIWSDHKELNDDNVHNSRFNVKDYCESGAYFTNLDTAVAGFQARVAHNRELVS